MPVEVGKREHGANQPLVLIPEALPTRELKHNIRTTDGVGRN
jgi:hypothetical protein